jgi:hypothetical protein
MQEPSLEQETPQKAADFTLGGGAVETTDHALELASACGGARDKAESPTKRSAAG